MVVVTCPSTLGRELDATKLASMERLGSEVTEPVDFTGDPANLVGKWIKVDQLGVGKVTKFKRVVNFLMYDSMHEVEFASGQIQLHDKAIYSALLRALTIYFTSQAPRTSCFGGKS